jgi:hypothetical protein
MLTVQLDQLVADRVEGPSGDILNVLLTEPLAEVFCCFSREGQYECLGRIEVTVGCAVSNPSGQYAGLARTGARDDRDGSWRGSHTWKLIAV